MKNMKRWRAARKAVSFGLQMAVLLAMGTAWLVLPGMIAQCRAFSEVLILLAVLAAVSVCAGATGWLAVEYDNRTNREWREYRRLLNRYAER